MSTPFISKIHLNTKEKEITLASKSLLAIVGPNNAGKTHFLRSVRSHLYGETVDEVSPESGIIAEIKVAWTENDEQTLNTIKNRIHSNFTKSGNHYYPSDNIKYTRKQGALSENSLDSLTPEATQLGVLTSLFLEFDDALHRISETEQKDLQTRIPGQQLSLIQLATESHEVSRIIKKYFTQIFHEDVSYYDRRTGTVGFLLAKSLPTASRAGEALDASTREHMESSPKLWLQGFGMRSVMGLLLRIFASEKSIILIDEPEAFLHPPQAAALGAVLSEIATSQNKQIILATHDRNLINGLLRNEHSDISIQRLSRANGISSTAPIDLESLKNVKQSSIMRYSTVLDSIFYRATVLVENEKDAYFYSAAIEYLLTTEEGSSFGISIDEIHFLSTAGKSGLAGTAELVRSLESFVLVIADFDLLDDLDQLKKTILSANGSEVDDIDELYQDLTDAASLTSLSDNELQKRFKKIKGVNSDNAEISEAAEGLIQKLAENQVILNQLGELEDFDRSIFDEGIQKNEWANRAIHRGVHQSPEARKLALRVLQTIVKATNINKENTGH